MSKKRFFTFAATLLFASVCSADFPLAENGKSSCNIVVKKDAPLPVSFGAKELALFTEKVSSAKIPVTNSAVKNLKNIFVGTLADKDLVKKSGIDAKKLKEDGFALTVKNNVIYIVGQNPRGALYGCYEIVKKYAGVRFLFPGEDGTYYSAKKSISIPEQNTIKNPYLRYRLLQCGDEINGATFLARNNLFGSKGAWHFFDKKGRRTGTADMFESVAVKTNATAGNSHIQSAMMSGWQGKKAFEKLYKEHPEYFPLIGGKRIFIHHGGDPNPCISNPGLLDLMAENLYNRVKGKYGAQEHVTIGNNDTTTWCECANCKKLDDPATAGTKGARANRYWYFVTEVAKRVWKKDPSINLGGWAYQDFWYPPTKVKIDPRLRVIISFNNQCWKHTITDKKCTVNAELLRIMAAWKKTKHPFIVNRDEIAANGSVGSNFLPSERVLYENLKSYPSIGFSGTYFCVGSPFPAFNKRTINKEPYFGKNYRYAAMWQTCYISAQYMWDINCDFDKLYEEANSLFYGKAWEGGYKEFRKLLTKYFLESPGCMGWGQGAPLGRCLDQAGSEEKLVSLMDKAVEAAKTDKDPRSLKHILQAKEIFEMTWRKQRKNYLDNFKELNVYRRTAPIKIDGILDEADWKNADALSNFKPGGHTPKNAKVQPSYVKVTYDPDFLYIAVECMEPAADKIIAGKNIKDRWKELGNHLELFYNYPDMAEKYYHLAINSNGEVIDAIQHSISKRDNSFNTRAKIATKVLKDRWILEIAVPANEIGMKCYDGSTWKLNVGRSRKVKDLASYSSEALNVETSSCCNGNFHGAANFVNIKFTPKRASGIAQSHDTSAWKNADFNTLVPDSSISKYYRYNRKGTWKFEDEKNLVPKFWTVNAGSVGTTKWDEKNPSNSYIQLEKGYITQYFVSSDKGKLKISFRARGKGSVMLWTSSFKNKASRTAKGYEQIKSTGKNKVFKLTDKWQNFSYETKKAGVPTERVAIRFTVLKNSVLDLDDVYVTPIPE